jgi:hypothetical protein
MPPEPTIMLCRPFEVGRISELVDFDVTFAAGRGEQPLLCLLEREDDSLLAGFGSTVEEFQQQDCLAGSGHTGDQETRTARNPLSQKIVELGNAGLAARRTGPPVFALEGNARREYLDALRCDDEGMLIAIMLGAAQLRELNEALRWLTARPHCSTRFILTSSNLRSRPYPHATAPPASLHHTSACRPQ